MCLKKLDDSKKKKTKARNHSNNNKEGKLNSNGGISCTLIAFSCIYGCILVKS